MRRLALVCLLAAGPAQALDCTKATTRAETAICADPAARAADEDMGKAFFAATSLMSPSDKAALTRAQALWIAERDRACSDQAGAKFAACLARRSLQRRAYLVAEPEAGPGAPGRLAPFVHYEPGSKRRAEVDLQLLKYPAPATPAERAFNAAVERIVTPELDKQPDADTPDGVTPSHDRTMRLVYASPRLISAHVDLFDDNGGPHPWPTNADINILVEAGREATFGDLIDARAAKKLFAFCLKAVRKQKGEEAQDDDAVLKGKVEQATARLDLWSFGPDAATIDYGAFSLGVFANGAFDCKIPYSVLKPLAKPGFPLPDVRPRPTP